ncbi:phytoene desaturase family protein [Rhodococcus sp. MTM3W5.2]|uniref:phytoene desaturase family protein n=1 Tax=Rhodococcus sp. MTM3W5.2 TaxID=1805827 RepID=UPI00097BBD67|nr:phytoene desaturase family protein [Rhodococcus sp. MTM3W5.2]
MGVGLRTVPGRTDHVVVVGAGLSGLSAALHLLGTGRAVTLLERDRSVGGRVGVYDGPGYQIDSGATVLTMPDLVAEALAAVGADFGSVSPPLRLHRLDPAYHARFADGGAIAVHSDPDAMAAEVTRACGPDEAGRYLRLRSWLERIFTAEFDRFIDANFDSPLDLVGSRAALADLSTLVRIGGFGRLGPRVEKYLRDPRLQRIFTFQSLYAGLSPARALGIYGAIAHMDTSMGVYFPDGGMRAIAEAMAGAFTGAGGTLALGTEVSRIDYRNGRATRVIAADGSGFEVDAVVLTADLGGGSALLPRRTWPRRPVRHSPSAVVAHGTIPASVAARWTDSGHHTIDFGAAWEQTFAEITARRGRGRLMSDPSLLLTRPAVTDPGLLIDRDGVPHEPLSVLAPCPNLHSAPLDWAALGRPYVRELLVELERRGYTGIAETFRVDLIDTPQTWADRGMAAGTPFAAAHTFVQTGPFRRGNLDTGAENVVLAGSGTTPGVGVPTVLVSGKLAAQRIAGELRARSQTHPARSRRFPLRNTEPLN